MEWIDFINKEKKQDYFINLMKKVEEEYKNHTCYPEYKNIFHAFEETPLNNVKVVILGQDPYHEPNQAHGLAFSVLCDKLPPSLVNIYKEMESDLGIKINQDGNLDYLAKQGVLLLNTVLTVREHEAFSHKNFGWVTFTDHVIQFLDSLDQPMVFILWGSPSQKKKALLKNKKHLIIESAHPSPLSAYRGFFGSKPFSKTNEYLYENNCNEIVWYK
ncbi:uracil-DNA glycosylase [Anaeroplasma bactoclasticum]|jgi:uracil-DNA glycosylase|uniref:Uracil-DNA glycosylase n=1 Tax=Anaeroplasma bactoclasticum TaxID=2088 RepID=A0A397RVW5_9MOLU|nr:uracil-DNA glycosylase [Anaeroplasma bactoclasticum]RIA75777.1 uracil-DNA glycosylase [Anaeroplasma bactoclasticum]